MKTILCYGDSNTWGYVPGSFDQASGLCLRYPCNKRWTGVVQQQLGEEYEVINCGLNGRTTNLDEPLWPNRNGLAHIQLFLETYAPIDLIILMLGTNDLKRKFSRSEKEIVGGFSAIIKTIRQFKCIDTEKNTSILLISPPAITSETSFGDDFKGAMERGRGLSCDLQALSSSCNCYFLDASNIPCSLIDGVHLDDAGHLSLGKLISEYLLKVVYSNSLTYSISM